MLHSDDAPPLVTVVHVPREGYSLSRRSLESVLEHTQEVPHELLILDAGSPPEIAQALAEAARGVPGAEVLRFEALLTPNELRNEAIRRCRTRYLAFVDNDAIVSPGWLPPLLRSAEAHSDAWAVGPTILIGELDEGLIHLAGGDGRVIEEDGRRRYSYLAQHYSGERLADVADQLRSGPCTCLEFHTLLVRRDAFDEVGLLDEGLMSFVECDDFCMKVTAAGGQIYFEPESTVTYLPPREGMTRADLEFFLLRWSDEWNERSLQTFMKTWELDEDDAWIRHARSWPKQHRRYALRHLAWPLGRLAGIIQYRLWHRLGDGLANWIEGRIDRRVRATRARALGGRASWQGGENLES